MTERKSKIQISERKYASIAGVLLLILLAALLVWFNRSTSRQAAGATAAQVYIDG